MGVRDLSLALPGFAAMFEFFEVRGGLEKGLKRREALPKAMEAKAGTAKDPVFGWSGS